ncbi:MAG: hypothetical protein BMS9Abin12_0848 [Acidimicrobiia bacterium]|nr:MAG: hypothetical protein BMS9Abin12_0848 [Acidimicrobiia bacterium]
MMNDQDRDLIAALAVGRLSTAAAEDAAARIEANPELASEYADQVAALEFLRSSAVPQMTHEERSALHINLTEKLGLTGEGKPAVPLKRRTRWWQPVFGLATAAAVVAAIVILPGTLTGGSSDESFSPASAELDSQSEALTATTIAAAGTRETPANDGQTLADETEIAVYETGSVELSDLLDRAQGASSPDDLDSRLAPLELTKTTILRTGSLTECLIEIEPDLPRGIQRILPLGAEDIDGSTIAYFGLDYGSGVEAGVSVNLSTCEIVDSDL